MNRKYFLKQLFEYYNYNYEYDRHIVYDECNTKNDCYYENEEEIKK